MCCEAARVREQRQQLYREEEQRGDSWAQSTATLQWCGCECPQHDASLQQSKKQPAIGTSFLVQETGAS